MKSKNGIIIIIGFIVLALLTLALMTSIILDYKGRMRNITDNYIRLGNSLSQTISMTYSFSDSISYKLEDFIYENMTNELFTHKEKYSMAEDMPFIVNDTLSQGFYFSPKSNDEYYAVTLFENRNVYEIKRIKKDLTGISLGGGIGQYIKNLEWLSSVEYVAIQDMNGILTATGNVSELSAIYLDSMLLFAMVEHEPILRESDFNGQTIREYVHPIENTDKLLRIGFKNADIESAVRSQKRVLFTGMLMVILFSSFAFFMFFYYYKALSLSGKIIERERRLSSIFKITKDPMIVKGNAGIEMNKAAEEIFKTKEELIGNEKLMAILSSERERINEPVVIDNRKMLASAVHSDDKMESILILNDITEIENLKEENEKKERRSMLGELSFKIAHELKNPLNGISIILQRISRRDTVTEEEKEMLKEAFNEVERMNKKIVDFMRYSKPGEYRFEKAKLEYLARNAGEPLKPMLDEKNIILEIKQFNEEETVCDIDYMIMAIRNIILNSIEASEKNSKIEVYPAENKRGITVRDYGCGIKKENLERIFDLYFTTKENGSGVGLATAFKIIKENGGGIDIESREGEGTKATVYFKEMNNG
ncbi:MAG: PAS domain-containing sensor histidine kinase [bacterium]